MQRCKVYKGPCNNMVIHVGATKHVIHSCVTNRRSFVFPSHLVELQVCKSGLQLSTNHLVLRLSRKKGTPVVGELSQESRLTGLLNPYLCLPGKTKCSGLEDVFMTVVVCSLPSGSDALNNLLQYNYNRAYSRM